jgi:hypothetical protein
MGVFNSLTAWFSGNTHLLIYLGLFSLITFVITTVAVPLFIVFLPEDYFTNEEKIKHFYKLPPPLLTLLIILKNILGILFVLTGIILLVLPGQGLLTILMGILLLDFPYKRQIELKVIKERHIFKGVNWIRKKFGIKPLLTPDPVEAEDKQEHKS